MFQKSDIYDGVQAEIDKLRSKVAEDEATLAELRQQRRELIETVEDPNLDADLGEAVFARDTDTAGAIHRGRAEDRQRVAQLDEQIPAAEARLAATRDELAHAERKLHLHNAQAIEAEIQAAARDFEDAQAALERTYVKLESHLQEQQAELTAAGGGHGSAATLLNRLRHVLAATLWRTCPRFCTAARLPRVPSAQQRTLDEFLSSSRPSRSDAA